MRKFGIFIPFLPTPYLVCLSTIAKESKRQILIDITQKINNN
jgi:hypothetical protein